MKTICPECHSQKKFWQLSDGRLKCATCRNKFTAAKYQLRIPKKILKQVISEFVLEHPTNTILDYNGLEKLDRYLRSKNGTLNAYEEEIQPTTKSCHS